MATRHHEPTSSYTNPGGGRNQYSHLRDLADHAVRDGRGFPAACILVQGPPAGRGRAAGSEAQRGKPSAAAASQPARRARPAVGDEVEADWSGEGEWFDGRVTRARADGTARARPGRSSALRILHSKSGLVWDF